MYESAHGARRVQIKPQRCLLRQNGMCIAWTPKYRRPVRIGAVRKRCHALIRQVAAKYDAEIIALAPVRNPIPAHRTPNNYFNIDPFAPTPVGSRPHRKCWSRHSRVPRYGCSERRSGENDACQVRLPALSPVCCAFNTPNVLGLLIFVGGGVLIEQAGGCPICASGPRPINDRHFQWGRRILVNPLVDFGISY
jgi:hypothetical protein